MLIKRLPSNICKQIWWCAIIGKGDFRNLCQKSNLHVMSNSKNRIGAQNFKPISYNCRHKSNIFIGDIYKITHGTEV